MKDKKNYGDYIIEYRKIQYGTLYFLNKKINNVDQALLESNKLKDMGYHDVIIKKNERNAV
jgi:hypothetical protein